MGTDVDIATGKALRAMREAKGLSQTDVAEAMNVKQAAVSQYETGKRPVTTNSLAAYATACDVNLTVTFHAAEGPSAAAARALEFIQEEE